MDDATIGEILQASGGAIKTGPFGTKLAASEYSDSGVPVVSVGEIGYGQIRVSERTKRVGSDVTDRLPEYLLEPGDIVFGRKGAVDRSAWVRPQQAGWFLGSDGIRLRFGEGVDSRFMAYQLGSLQIREWLRQHAVGTTLASLNEPTLKSVPVSLPPIEEQRAIAATLGALDDKIESNDRIALLGARLVDTAARQLMDGATDEVSIRGRGGFQLLRRETGGTPSQSSTSTSLAFLREVSMAQSRPLGPMHQVGLGGVSRMEMSSSQRSDPVAGPSLTYWNPVQTPWHPPGLRS